MSDIDKKIAEIESRIKTTIDYSLSLGHSLDIAEAPHKDEMWLINQLKECREEAKYVELISAEIEQRTKKACRHELRLHAKILKPDEIWLGWSLSLDNAIQAIDSAEIK